MKYLEYETFNELCRDREYTPLISINRNVLAIDKITNEYVIFKYLHIDNYSINPMQDMDRYTTYCEAYEAFIKYMKEY